MISRNLFWSVGVSLAVVGIVIAVIAVRPEQSTVGADDGEWTCSMHPQVRSSKPGPCPICGMNLIPVAQLSSLSQIEKRAGIETEPVKQRELFKEVRTVGKLNYSERRVADITARFAGRVDRIYADFTGVQVAEGDHLADIYSPDLYVAQRELRLAVESSENARDEGGFGRSNLEAARTKLRLLGILPEQIAEIEKSRKPKTYLTIYAPMGGTVIEKNIRTGQYVEEGDLLYRIADLDPIWLYLDIYESDLAWVRFGQTVDVTLEAYPTESFRGLVTFIDPFLDDKTRTVKVRVNLKNADGRLKPAMYASALIRVRLQSDGTPEPTGMEGKYVCPMHPEIVEDEAGNCRICEMPLVRVPEVPGSMLALGDGHKKGRGHEKVDHKDLAEADQVAPPDGVLAIRSSAVLDTGRRKVTYRRRKDGAYELVELKLGLMANGTDDAGKAANYFPVLKGLKVGDQVVVRGGFLLDSQRQIEGMPSLLYTEGRSAAGLHAGHGAATPSSPGEPASTEHKH